MHIGLEWPSVRRSDSQGVDYDGNQVWEYVNGPASSMRCTSRMRDEGNVGMLPEDFRTRANAHIRTRWPEAPPEALLTLSEVLACRLYTGPGYQPINSWLRHVGTLDSRPRREAALSPEHSYGATVRHVIDAIRKIAAVNTPQESDRVLYRGLRGVLPKRFWLADGLGFVAATDTAFMSTSSAEETPLEYMKPHMPNLLWELHASAESDVGYHCGADISFLSQFAAEKEVLFPPMTMLKVISRQPYAADQQTPGVVRRSLTHDLRRTPNALSNAKPLSKSQPPRVSSDDLNAWNFSSDWIETLSPKRFGLEVSPVLHLSAGSDGLRQPAPAPAPAGSHLGSSHLGVHLGSSHLGVHLGDDSDLDDEATDSGVVASRRRWAMLKSIVRAHQPGFGVRPGSSDISTRLKLQVSMESRGGRCFERVRVLPTFTG